MTTILDEAAALVGGDRNDAYGDPAADWDATGRIWAAILDRWLHAEHPEYPRLPDIPARIAILSMVGVKLSREAHKPGRDNRVDAVGYVLCADQCVTGYDRT